MMSNFHSLKTRISSDVMKIIDEGTSRDEIMIHVGMLLMLDHLDYAFRDFFVDSRNELSQGAPTPYEDGDNSSNRIQIKPIVENVAVSPFYN